MTWFGESYRLGGGHAIAGTMWTAIDEWFDHFDDAAHTVTAGDDVIVGSYAQPRNFSEFADYTDPIQVRWVLEVGGGSGALALSAGLDGTFNYNDPALAVQDLGTVTITGPDTVVSGLLSVTHDDLLAYAADPILRIRCTSGAVTLRQVKLRVWPAGGAPGAWVPVGEGIAHGTQVQRRGMMVAPGTVASQRFFGNVEDYRSYPDPDGAKDAVMDAQPDAIAHLAAAVGGASDFLDFNGTNTGPVAQAVATGNEDLMIFAEEGYAAFYRGRAAVISKPGYVWADPGRIMPEVDVANLDPNHHKFEDEAWMRPAGGGRLVRSFGGWTTAKIRATYGRVNTPGETHGWATGPANVHQVTVGEKPSQTPPFVLVTGGATTVIPPGVEGVDVTVQQDIPLTGGEVILFGIDVPGIFSPAESAAGLLDSDWFGHPTHAYRYNNSGQVDLIDTGYLVTFGPLEVWDPEAILAPTREPRFFVKEDDLMRPVGFGKPADEPRAFHVPTAMGAYRDLTWAEYQAVGGPLPDFTP